MKRHKNLERAIVLSLLMSSSIYGTVFAADKNIEEEEYIKSGSIIISAGSGNWSITATNGNIELNATDKVVYYNNKVADVILNAKKENIISSTNQGLYLDNQQKDFLNNVGIYAGEGNIINTTKQAIYITPDSNFNVEIKTGSGDNNITSTDSTTIQAKSGMTSILSNEGNNIITSDSSKAIEATNDANITINGNKNSVSGKIGISAYGTTTKYSNVKVIADENNIIEGTDTAINLGSSSLISIQSENENNFINSTNKSAIIANGSQGIVDVLAQKGNYITSKNGDGVLAQHGATVNIVAGNENISLLTDYIDVDNVIKSGASGLHTDGSGTINAIASHDNTIFGTTNGILSNGVGLINVKAGYNNVIGQYTDEEGTHTSQNGINVSSGTVTITSGKGNNIYQMRA